MIIPIPNTQLWGYSCRGVLLWMGSGFHVKAQVACSPLTLVSNSCLVFSPIRERQKVKDYGRDASYLTWFLYTLMARQTTLLRKINVLSSENLLHPHVVTLFTQLDGLEELQRNKITTYYFSRTFTSMIWSLMNNICHNCQHNWTKDTWGDLMHYFFTYQFATFKNLQWVFQPIGPISEFPL